MARLHCRGYGQLPDGKPCDAFDHEKLVCTGDGSCRLAYVMQSDEEIAAREMIGMPEELDDLKLLRKGSLGIATVLNYKNEVTEPVEIALGIIDKMNPHNKIPGASDDQEAWSNLCRYWDNPTEIDRDLGMLSAIRSRIDTQAGIAQSAVENAVESLSLAKAEKSLAIKKSLSTGLRTEKMTDHMLKMYVKADPQIKQAQEDIYKARREANLLYTLATTIEKHINVLKKRLEAFRKEYHNADR